MLLGVCYDLNLWDGNMDDIIVFMMKSVVMGQKFLFDLVIKFKCENEFGMVFNYNIVESQVLFELV